MTQDLSYLTGIDTDRISILEVKGDGSGVIVYVRIVWLTDDYIQAQVQGGDLILGMQSKIEDPTSIFYRGFINNNAVSAYGLAFCVPGLCCLVFFGLVLCAKKKKN